jgi:miniconductance mechanosensitive channel
VDISQIQEWLDHNLLLGLLGLITIGLVVFFIARSIIARSLVYITKRTKTEYDDIVVNYLHPFRVAWLMPLLVVYFLAEFFPVYQVLIEKTMLFFVIWVVAFTLNSLLGALNQIYESRPNFSGVSIQGYLDIVKILVILVGVILSISLFTGESPLVLLSGLGALTAVLLLIFRDTILSLVASIQISSLDLVKQGDWIEVPSYGADGDVIDISLHSIKIQNFDKTITVVPTHKMIEVAYKNWRGMQESGGRRIKRSINLDLTSLKFCDREMLERLRNFDLIRVKVDENIKMIDQYEGYKDSTLDGPQFTNAGIFHTYIEEYLKSHQDIHGDAMTFLVRQLPSSSLGLPIEIYVFTKTTVWTEYEKIQAEIFYHLIAVAPYFDLRIYQELAQM